MSAPAAPAHLSQARALLSTCEVIDLHVDSFIWHRTLGRKLGQRHGTGPFAGRFLGHLDFPRAIEGGLTGAMWSITTNPFRTRAGRWRTFQRNLDTLVDAVQATEGRVRVARTAAEYRAARARGAHVCLPAIQGGNALDGAPDGPASIRDRLITRVTLVHLTNSGIGATSSPGALGRRGQGLTAFGKALVERLDAQRVFVDLAHIDPQGFWDAVDVHDRALPLIATHTGVAGVRPHWRNLDDRQLRAVADSGGVVGIIFHGGFLFRPDGPRDAQAVLEHMEHVIAVAGEQAAAIGSDMDGAITPPGELRDGASAWVRLVQAMLDRGWPEARIRRVLGENFLASFERLRPDA